MLISGTTRDDPGSCRIIGCGPIDAEHDVWVADRVDIGRFPGYTRPETGLETAATAGYRALRRWQTSRGCEAGISHRRWSSRPESSGAGE